MLRKHFRLFLVLTVISVSLMMYQSRQGPLRPLWFLSLALENINTSITTARDVWRKTFRMVNLRESELQHLKREVRILRLRELRHREVIEENRRLREILNLGSRYSPSDVVARIVSRGSDRFASTIIINKGTLDGIEKDMPVITPEGLLGKVYRAEPGNSVVMLLDDTRFSAAVRLQQSRAEAIVSGSGQGSCQLKYLGTDQEITIGDTLVTSGLDEFFLQGIPVGAVLSVETKEAELFHTIEVIPFVDLRKIEEVIVLVQ